MGIKTNILIEAKFTAPPSGMKRKRSNKPTCHSCGAPLTDPKSIARGYGPKCAEKHMIIIFHIPSEQEAQPAQEG